MIDYLKIVIYKPDLIQRVWNNQNLIFESDENRRFNDEIRTKWQKKYINLVFTRFADRLEIAGSLHKFFNNGIHNANDFGFKFCIRVIEELESIFDLDLKECIIVNIEFGLNIIPCESVKDILVWLKFHEHNEFRYFPGLQFAKMAGSFSKCGKINRYKTIKAYAKGLEPFGGKTYENPNTLRIEIQSHQSKYINKLGIYTLADLMDTTVYIRLGSLILKEWENVLLIDKTLPETNKKLYQYQNVDFWEKCLNEYRNKFASQKRNYYNLLKNYPENVHSKIQLLLKTKLETFEVELKNSAISTQLQLNQKNKSGAISTRLLGRVKNGSGAISNYVKMEIATRKNKYCIVTGLEMHDQTPGTINLTERGVKWYYENEPETYKNELEILLTQKWLNKHRGELIKNYFAEIYHQIRNRKHNPKNNPRNNTKNSFRNIERKGLKLWPMAEMVDPEKLRLIS